MSALSVYLPPREYIKIFVLPSLTSVSFSLGKNNNNHDNLPMAFFFLYPLFIKSSKMVDTDLCVSNLSVEHLIQDDEAIWGARCFPFNQHIWRLGRHYLMDHRAWDVICFLCEYQT